MRSGRCPSVSDGTRVSGWASSRLEENQLSGATLMPMPADDSVCVNEAPPVRRFHAQP
jgi:hypothetical protein